MFILGPLFLLLIVGLALSLWAWRGKRVDDHPVCRKCGFDLFGSPDAKTCPECGTVLSGPRSIRRGNRRRRKLTLAMGMALLVLAFGSGGVVGYAMLSGPKILQSLPVWAVRWEAYYGRGSLTPPALTELNHRLKAGHLSKTQVNAVAADALAVQADMNRRWNPAWGDFIDAAHSQQVLSKRYWKQYAAALAQQFPTLTLRQTVRQGAPLPYRLTASNVRCGHHNRLSISLFLKSISFNGKVEKISKGLSAPGLNAHGTSSITSRLNLPSPPPLGPQRVSLHVRSSLGNALGPNTKALIQIDKTLHGKITVVPVNQPTVHAVTDPSKQAAVRAAIQEQNLAVGRSWRGQKGLRLISNLQIGKRPVGLAFKVTARDHAGHVWELGSFDAAANNAGTWGMDCDPFKGCKAADLDIILTPSAKVAEHSVDITDYWGKPIIFKHVKVDWSAVPNAQRPKALRSHP